MIHRPQKYERQQPAEMRRASWVVDEPEDDIGSWALYAIVLFCAFLIGVLWDAPW